MAKIASEKADLMGGVRVKTINMTASLYPGDHKMLGEIQAFLGSNRSDAVRGAIRAYYGFLKGSQL